MESVKYMDIGKKIKDLRIAKSLTQEELADRAELNKGFISQLGTDLKNFFDNDEDNQVVFSKEDYFEKEDAELKNMIQWIIPNAQKNLMEPILLTLEPGGSTYPDNPHEGEEFGYVLSGNVTVVLGNKAFKAKKGESFYYEAKYKHHLESKNGAKIIWVSGPPSF